MSRRVYMNLDVYGASTRVLLRILLYVYTYISWLGPLVLRSGWKGGRLDLPVHVGMEREREGEEREVETWMSARMSALEHMRG